MIQDPSPDSEMRLSFLTNGVHKNQTTFMRRTAMGFYRDQNGIICVNDTSHLEEAFQIEID